MASKIKKKAEGCRSTFGAWSVLGTVGLALLGCTALSIDAEAQSAQAQTKAPVKKGVSDVVRAINGPNSDVGMVVMFHYDGTIETFSVDRNANETENTDAPPAGRTTLNQMTGADFEIYQVNPNCITCKHGGSYYTICR
ncbi:MAG: hypothetical protein ACR2RA_09430 [Geminicoccaceae bacterium]